MYLHSTPNTAPLQDTSFPRGSRARRGNPSGLASPGPFGTETAPLAPWRAPEPARSLTLSAFRTARRAQAPSHRMTHIREVIPRVMAGLLAQLGSRR
jgi:hypothetical protein